MGEKRKNYVHEIQEFGFSKYISQQINLSMDNTMFQYYMISDIILYYIFHKININSMTIDEICKTLQLRSDIVSMIYEYLKHFNYLSPYSWIYHHILTYENRKSIHCLNELFFNDDITMTDIIFYENRINLFTVKSNINYDQVYKIIEDETTFDNKKKCKLWYHGTSRACADNIINCGICTKYCDPIHNFGTKSTFYVEESFNRAIKLATLRNNPNINDYPCVIVFKTNLINKEKNILETTFYDDLKVYDLSLDEEEWKKYTNHSINAKPQIKKYFPIIENTRKTDLIYGPILIDKEKINHDNMMQLALKSQNAQDAFSNEFIHAIIIFEGNINF